MKCNIVQVSSFTQRKIPYGRLDAEFVDSDMLQLENSLVAEHKAQPLSELLSKDVDTYLRPKEDSGNTCAYVAIDNIDAQDGFLFNQSLAESELPSRAKYKLESFDIVLSNVRPERGAVGSVIPSHGSLIGSSGLTVIRVEDAQTRNVLFAYLRSQYARTQLVRRSRGSMYPAVTKDDVAEILVPKFKSSASLAVNLKVEESLEFRKTFFAVFNEQAIAVEAYLNSALGTPPPDIVLDIAEDLPIRIAKCSELLGGAKRFDAEFHRKEFVEFEGRLKNIPGVVRLGSLFEAFAGGAIGKGTETLNRLRQAQLSGFGISYGGCEEIENAKISARMTIQESDVLIGCTAHEPQYVGNRVDLIDDLPEQLANSIAPVPDVMIIRRRDEHGGLPPIFLASFLRSKWGRRQFQRLNRGVRGGHVYGQDVEAFIYVPVPPADWMKIFNERQESIRAARRGSITSMAAATKLIEDALR